MQYYVIEIQTNHDGTSGNFVFGFADKTAAEDKFLALRQYANQSSVMVHTIMFINNRGGNVQPPAVYVHPAPEPEPEEAE